MDLFKAIRGAFTGNWSLGAKDYQDLVCSRHVAPSDRAFFAGKCIEAHQQGRHGRGGHSPGRSLRFRTHGNMRRTG